jgi:hypothetical protein
LPRFLLFGTGGRPTVGTGNVKSPSMFPARRPQTDRPPTPIRGPGCERFSVAVAPHTHRTGAAQPATWRPRDAPVSDRSARRAIRRGLSGFTRWLGGQHRAGGVKTWRASLSLPGLPVGRRRKRVGNSSMGTEPVTPYNTLFGLFHRRGGRHHAPMRRGPSSAAINLLNQNEKTKSGGRFSIEKRTSSPHGPCVP